MKRLSENFREILNNISNTISTILLSSAIPVIDLFIDVNKTLLDAFGLNYKIIDKISQIIIKNIKKTATISLFLYYIILLISELYILIKVLYGKIQYFDFLTLFIYTVVILLFSLIFVSFLNKNYKSKKFNYLIYFQILFLLPLGAAYWIANIEGHDLYLKNLTSDQWISLFNTIIIYFSGCFIGLVTLHKSKEEEHEK